jgi:hypothetical protein
MTQSGLVLGSAGLANTAVMAITANRGYFAQTDAVGYACRI